MTDDGTPQKVAELIKDVKVAMLTYRLEDGSLHSKPMATQDVEFDGTSWFVAQRDTDKVEALQKDPQVNLAYSGSGTWVSLSGRAAIVDDVERLKEYWNTFTDSWLDGGPEDPQNILIRVDADSAEYWDAPGGAATQVLNLVKSKVTGDRVEGDHGTVDL